VACGVERLNAGSNTDPGSEPDAGLSRSLWPYGAPSNSFDLPCTLPAPDALAGTWQGEFDSYALPSGSRAIRIDITGAYLASDGLCGTVEFGNGDAPPVATDPEAPPPGQPAMPDPPPLAHLPTEGFPFEFYEAGTPVIDAGVSSFPPGKPAVLGNRVRFGISLRQVYKSWCNLQLSYFVRPGMPSQSQLILEGLPPMFCVPPDTFTDGPGGLSCGGNIPGVTVQHVSCVQAEYCLLRACDCNSASFDPTDPKMPPPHGCTVLPSTELLAGIATFDLTLDGATLSGNVTFPQNVQSIHLTRSP
jgi:hypothetical protein